MDSVAGRPVAALTAARAVRPMEPPSKALAHNLLVLNHEMYELGIEPALWP